MVNIRANERQKVPDSPKTEVGEIDTRAPFQSVKAAVSLFGEVAISTQKSTPRRSRSSSENVLDKETQCMLAQKELNKIRKKLESSETTRARAVAGLERAKRTVQELSLKLEAVSKSKQSAFEAKEAVKRHSEQLKAGGYSHNQELEHAREQYLIITAELDATKQELTRCRRDFDAAMEEKVSALQQAVEAQRAAGANSEKVSEISKEISDMKDAIQQLNLTAAQNHQEHEKLAKEREAQKQSYKAAYEEAEKRLQALKQEYNSDVMRNLEVKLADKNAEIEILQEEMNQAHASEMNAVRIITNDLDEATKMLQEVSDEETSLRSLVSSLRTELEGLRREKTELEQKEAERAALEKQKQLDKLQEESLKVEQMLSEAENMKREAEEMSKNAQCLKQEAEATQLASEEADKKLELVLKMVEEAKAAEKKAHEEKKILSEEQAARGQESATKIKMSMEDYESLKGKVDESVKLVEIKAASVAAQLIEIRASKEEADKKLEESLRALEEIKTATEMALKSAETAEAAKSAVDAELQKWRQQE